MSIYLITKNQNKLQEIQAIIPEVELLDIDLPEIQSFSAEEVIKEKLILAQKVYPEKEFIIEDTSFYMNCLGGFPGPFVKFFIKENSLEDIYRIAQDRNNNNAQAKTIIGYASKEKKIHYFEGLLEGEIIKPKVYSKTSWDPIFKPSCCDKSFGEMSIEEKNNISMRIMATEKLKDFLEKNSLNQNL
ncbi:MAG: non-canonical purine NTP pyrophosphatase [Nanoarchaeota archaeon]|jgi:inosine triphosphate pyrophosphatase|nr:non-canonical purine NTP pyrophosphatase [Nanoarchaeota archaeon]